MLKEGLDLNSFWRVSLQQVDKQVHAHVGKLEAQVLKFDFSLGESIDEHFFVNKWFLVDPRDVEYKHVQKNYAKRP